METIDSHNQPDSEPAQPQHGRGSAEEERAGYSPFPIVGIGASAGGLEAYMALLGKLPPNTGMAFLVVQHLDPRHESRLTDLLSRATPMPVVEAVMGIRVRPDHVYVIPPNTNMAISRGALQLTSRSTEPGTHLPVDFLFRSLAEDQQSRAIAVVLSGTGSDGTNGLCEIKAVGGITFAQSEQTARHTGMPHSAIDSGCADFVLSPEEIAARLSEIGEHPYLAPTSTTLEETPDIVGDFKRILNIVRAVTRVDFSQYRDTTIRRRIMRRLALHSQRSLSEYAQLLESDRAEVEALYHDLLINVTSFFRDPEVFDALKQVAFPEIMRGRHATNPVRIWVPGCSTGQEAYSLAIALLEFLDDKPVRPPIQIFATDLSDPASLDKARSGAYPESIEGEVTPERLRRFFKKEDHVYRIDKGIRDMCVFARQNVAADPPFSHVDLISCRNVLIYLATPLQRRVVPSFHYALNNPGFLVLGTAETVGDASDLFDLVDRTHKIYLKKPSGARPPLQFALDDMTMSAASMPRRSDQAMPTTADYVKEADRLVIGRYGPPSVLVNENFDIVQFRGQTSPYLAQPSGEPTVNLLKLAREGLFLELRSALNEAKTAKEAVRRDSIRVRDENQVRTVSLEVMPIRPGGAPPTLYLVLFSDTGSVSAPRQPSEPAPTPKSPTSWFRRLLSGPADPAPAHNPSSAHDSTSAELAQLRKELSATKDYLQSLVEQQDAANEELRSANEEILSSNEELQSTNEELETAKEELQSSNEELTTVNEQLQHRNLELNQTTNDLTNLLASTTIPVIMVGSDLRIRRSTPPARKVMNLLPTDTGRPVGDLKANVDVPDLDQMIADVIEQVQVREREVCDRHGRWYSLRIHPYRTGDNKIDGAVIVLLDIDEAKRGQIALQQSEERYRHLFESSNQPIMVFELVYDTEGQISDWILREANSEAIQRLGRSLVDLVGRRVTELFGLDWAIPRIAESREVMASERGKQFETDFANPDKQYLAAAFPLGKNAQGKDLYAVSAVDIGPLKQAESALREAHDELEARIQERTAELAAANAALVQQAEERERAYAAAQYARKVAETTSSANLAIAQTLSFDSVLDTLLDYLKRLVPYDMAAVLLLDAESRLVVHASRASAEWFEPVLARGAIIDTRNDSVFASVFDSRESVLIPDTQKMQAGEDSPMAALGRERAASWLGVPLQAGGDLLGLFLLEKAEPNAFTPDHRRLAEALVGPAAAAIQNVVLFEQLRASHERMQTLSRRLVEVQESERRVVARELHDEASQALAALTIDLNLLQREADDPAAVRRWVAKLDGTLKGIQENLHRLAMDLRPATLDHVGLKAALIQQCDALRERNGLNVTCNLEDTPERLSPEMETALYRIAQEALTNVIRHARARSVGVELRFPDNQVKLTVQDDGTGFEMSPKLFEDRIGLLGMRERAEVLGGAFALQSAKGAGTTISVTLPLRDGKTPSGASPIGGGK